MFSHVNLSTQQGNIMQANNSNIIVRANEYGTLFVYMGGHMVADSCVFNRKRGFGNKLSGQYAMAADFTPAKVRKDPSKVLAYLAMTGTVACGSVVIDY